MGGCVDLIFSKQNIEVAIALPSPAGQIVMLYHAIRIPYAKNLLVSYTVCFAHGSHVRDKGPGMPRQTPSLMAYFDARKKSEGILFSSRVLHYNTLHRYCARGQKGVENSSGHDNARTTTCDKMNGSWITTEKLDGRHCTKTVAKLAHE